MLVKLIQITDLHIGTENENPFEVDVRLNFERLLEAVGNEQFDHLVVSGDLCYRDPDEAIYRWIKTKLDQLTTNYSVISGNHDDNTMINDIFYQKEDQELFYFETFHGKSVYFLDTHSGVVDQKQLAWLQQMLDNEKGPVIIFMHHPPAICQVPHMDGEHYLKNFEEVQTLFHDYHSSVHVFCGHYHLEKSVFIKNIHVHITPSNFFQIDDRYKHFKIASYQIGYRHIVVDDNMLYTSVKYLNHK